MARILYWNINNFSLPKIADPRDPPSSRARLEYITDNIVDPLDPDIFVIVEVHSRTGDVGQSGMTVNKNSRFGVNRLLSCLRRRTPGPWCLVPPVYTGLFGFREAIAVYYKEDTLQFTGPFVYGPDYLTATYDLRGWLSEPLNRACPEVRTNRWGAMPNPVPHGWQTGPQRYMPRIWESNLANRPAVGGLFQTNPLNENQLAGQWQFFDHNTDAPIYFPSELNRAPFYTRFLDNNGRTIKLFSIHTSPGDAVNSVARLAGLAELRAAANEVTVIVGDFNVDTFVNLAAYRGLVDLPGNGGLGMAMAFSPVSAGAVRAERLPYCMTHLLPVDHATPYGAFGNPTPTNNVGPRFGYMGAMGGQYFTVPGDHGAIDNIFTLYGGGNAVGPATNPTLVNTITGTPYANPGMAYVTAELTGGLPVGSSMGTPIPMPNGINPASPNAANDLATFREWDNFYMVRDVSDHIPLCIDV